MIPSCALVTIKDKKLGSLRHSNALWKALTDMIQTIILKKIYVKSLLVGFYGCSFYFLRANKISGPLREVIMQVLEATQAGIWTLQTFLQQEDAVLCPYMVPLLYVLLLKTKHRTIKRDEQGEKPCLLVWHRSVIFSTTKELMANQQSPGCWLKRVWLSAGFPFLWVQRGERKSKDFSQIRWLKILNTESRGSVRVVGDEVEKNGSTLTSSQSPATQL